MIFKIFGRRKAEAASDTPAQTHQPTPHQSSEPARGQSARRRKGGAGGAARTATPTTGEGNMPNSHHSGHSTADKRHGQPKQAGQHKAATIAAWDPSQFLVEPQPGRTRFHDFDLPDTLMRGIAELGFSYCTPIQARSLPESLRGHDVVGKAQTGTGKTAAFLITLINDMLRHPVKESRYAGEARAIILAPTRELAMQIGEDAKNLSRYCGLHVHTLVGGMDYGKQKERLHGKLVDILVATPGRLIDFLESRDVYLDEVEFLVIDEADRMLDMGFIPQVKRIVRCTPQKMNRQTLLFSATFTHDVLSLADQWTHNAVHIEIEPERVAADAVEQKIYAVSENDKLVVLYNLLQDPAVESVLVFANRRDITHWVYDSLVALGCKCGILAGDVAQNRRISTLENFREGKLRVLVATDVAGRGIHISGITHVINFNLPEEPEDYVHRIGRTGRAGAKGVSISFASEDDAFQLPALEKLLGRKFECEQPAEALFTPFPAGVKVPSAAPRPRPQRPGMGAGRGGGYRGGRR